MFQLLLAVIYLAFISLGLPDSLLGSAWPTDRIVNFLYLFPMPAGFHDHCSRNHHLQPAKRPSD